MITSDTKTYLKSKLFHDKIRHHKISNQPCKSNFPKLLLSF